MSKNNLHHAAFVSSYNFKLIGDDSINVWRVYILILCLDLTNRTSHIYLPVCSISKSNLDSIKEEPFETIFYYKQNLFFEWDLVFKGEQNINQEGLVAGSKTPKGKVSPQQYIKLIKRVFFSIFSLGTIYF